VYGQVVAQVIGVLEHEGDLVEMGRCHLAVGDCVKTVAVRGHAKACESLARLAAWCDEDSVACEGRCTDVYQPEFG